MEGMIGYVPVPPIYEIGGKRMNKKEILIGKYDSLFKSDEPVYEDFISRKEFINRTGIYESTMNYAMVYDEFKETGLSVDEFVDTYEENHPIEEVKLHGTFKFEVTDDNVNGLGTYHDDHFPYIWEIVNMLDMELYHKWLHGGENITTAMKIIEDQEKIISNAKNLLLEFQKTNLVNAESNGGKTS